MARKIVSATAIISILVTQITVPLAAQPVPVQPTPPPGGPQIQPPRPVEPVPVRPTPSVPGGPQIQPPRPVPQVQPPRPVGPTPVRPIPVYPIGQDFAGQLRCESRNNRYQQCNVPTSNRVELIRRLSGKKCNQGRQWGYSDNYIWVNNGCRAEFGYGYRYANPQPPYPQPDRDKGPSTGLIIGGIVVAGGLLALLASKKKKSPDEKAEAGTYPARPPAALSANLQSLPSASRPSVQNCLSDAARQIGVTGGSRLSLGEVVSLEPGNGGWRIRAMVTATYPDGDQRLEMYCRATPTQIVQLDIG